MLPKENSVLLSKQLLIKQREIKVHTWIDLGKLVRCHHSLVLPLGCISRAEGSMPLSTPGIQGGKEQDFIAGERRSNLNLVHFRKD